MLLLTTSGGNPSVGRPVECPPGHGGVASPTSSAHTGTVVAVPSPDGPFGGEPVVDREELARLHETYVWHVNAAVGEGRMDLVERLADEYLEEALGLLTDGDAPGCDKPDCPACRRQPAPPQAPPQAPRHTGWRRWLGGPRPR